jgi:GDPmannose 4,6-dehydratase
MTLRAIIVGSTGQDGTLLTDLLLGREYEVIGLGRTKTRDSSGACANGPVEIADGHAVHDLVARTRPDEVYFLAAHHHSSEDDQGDEGHLFQMSTETHLTALVAFLEAIRRVSPCTRLFYAASSHVFGTAATPVQDEKTPINPETVYGITKAAGLFACRRYREVHGLFASVGILYNHESPLRSARFVSKKIAAGAAAVKLGRSNKIVLGDLDASADWGYAPDYVDAMHRMLQLGAADDFVLATGTAHTVRDFASVAFDSVGLDYAAHIETDPAVVRRYIPGLVGNPAKFAAASGWKPSIGFREMVSCLVTHELEHLDGE